MPRNLYYCKPDVSIEITGNTFPAAQSFDDYDFNAPRSVHKFKFDRFPDFVPDIRYQLSRTAKVCDVLSQASISACGLLVSPGFKELLTEHQLADHQFFAATVKKDEAEMPYFWLHVLSGDPSIVDFPRSQFIQKRTSRKEADLRFSNLEEYLQKKEEIGFLSSIRNELLVLKEVPEADLWVEPFATHLVISEKLKTAIDSQGITGLQLEKAEGIVG